MNLTTLLRSMSVSAIVLFITTNLMAQDFTGLWLAQSVMVGNEMMSPRAKWSQINSDSTFTSGNGWLRNSEGTWTYDEETKQFLTQSKQDLREQIPFTVSFDDSIMIWTREEQGEMVTVRWVPIDDLPRAENEMIIGVWELEEYKTATSESVADFDPNGLHYAFFSWDGRYRIRKPNGDMERGIYWVHPHRREVMLSPWEGESRTLDMGITEDHIFIMRDDATNPEVRTYRRIMHIPD